MQERNISLIDNLYFSYTSSWPESKRKRGMGLIINNRLLLYSFEEGNTVPKNWKNPMRQNYELFGLNFYLHP